MVQCVFIHSSLGYQSNGCLWAQQFILGDLEGTGFRKEQHTGKERVSEIFSSSIKKTKKLMFQQNVTTAGKTNQEQARPVPFSADLLLLSEFLWS